MRNYLTDIEVVGAVLVYQEGEQCRWSIDWLYANCDRVCIVLDNYNEETKNIVMEYKNKNPDRTHVAYTDILVSERQRTVQGQGKKRFKSIQPDIRECVLKEIKKMHDEKPIDLIIWPDSDETFIDEFSEHLKTFWNSKKEFMVLGCVEVYESMQILISQTMGTHGRVYKYTPEMTVFPWIGRTRYHPHISGSKKPVKMRHVIVHVNHLTEQYRKQRMFVDNRDFLDGQNRSVWFLPKDVRQMSALEIGKYQVGPHRTPSEMPSIPIEEFIKNKKELINKYNLKIWTQD